MSSPDVRGRVDPSNAALAEAWDGAEGRFWAQHADRFDRGVPAHLSLLVDASAVEDGDRVVDVGCGNGRLACDVAVLIPHGSVLGVDLSGPMLDVARGRAAAEHLDNVVFTRGDAQVYPFVPASYDVIISRCGTMFFGDRTAAFRNIATAVRSGGRLAMLVWRGPEHNEWVVGLRAALAAGRDLPLPPVGAPGPFALADPGSVTELLTGCGFHDVTFSPIDAPMWFGADPDEARPFILGTLGWLLDGLDAVGRRRALSELDNSLRTHHGPAGVTYASGAWLIRAWRA